MILIGEELDVCVFESRPGAAAQTALPIAVRRTDRQRNRRRYAMGRRWSPLRNRRRSEQTLGALADSFSMVILPVPPFQDLGFGTRPRFWLARRRSWMPPRAWLSTRTHGDGGLISGSAELSLFQGVVGVPVIFVDCGARC